MSVHSISEPKTISAPLFDEFWAIYPRKIARRYAEKCWLKLTDPEKWAAVAAMPKHIAAWRDAARDAEKIPHASTWLNGGRWEDVLDVAMPKAIICAWPKCERIGLHHYGSGNSYYCENHMQTLKRGGTPPR